MERISRRGGLAGDHRGQNSQFINGLVEILAGRRVAEKAARRNSHV
jgi:hypothetical protein